MFEGTYRSGSTQCRHLPFYHLHRDPPVRIFFLILRIRASDVRWLTSHLVIGALTCEVAWTIATVAHLCWTKKIQALILLQSPFFPAHASFSKSNSRCRIRLPGGHLCFDESRRQGSCQPWRVRMWINVNKCCSEIILNRSPCPSCLRISFNLWKQTQFVWINNHNNYFHHNLLLQGYNSEQAIFEVFISWLLIDRAQDWHRYSFQFWLTTLTYLQYTV